MLSAVSAIGAQNIGAGKPQRARETLRYAVCITVGFGVAVSVLAQFIAEPVVGLFTSDADVITAGGQYMRGYIFDCIFAGVHFSFSEYFCACGKSGISFLHNIVSITLVRIPCVYAASRLFPATLFPHGACDRGWVSRFGRDLPRGLRADPPPGARYGNRGVNAWICQSSFASTTG